MSKAFTGSIPHNKLDSLTRAANRAKSLADYRASTIANPTDNYVKNLLTSCTGLAADDIPESLVEIKRTHLQIKRLLNEKRQ